MSLPKGHLATRKVELSGGEVEVRALTLTQSRISSDLDGVVARAGAAGVGLMVTISTRIRQFEQILGIAERYDNVFCSVGTHPHNAHEELDIPVEEIVRLPVGGIERIARAFIPTERTGAVAGRHDNLRIL